MTFSSTLLAATLCVFSLVLFSQTIDGQISTDPNGVGFYLYPNQANNTDNDLLIYGDISSIQASRYNASKKLIIYTSGFLQNLTSDQAIKNAYLRMEYTSTSNIIVVAWGALSGNSVPAPNISSLALLAAAPEYVVASSNVYVVATRIQEFLSFLGANNLLPPNGAADIHLVGQSLGAQVMGMAGSGYYNATGQRIGRITGTEPASPLFQALPPFLRIDTSDATFVDIVHTNQGEAGWLGPVGDVDFYVNGGGPIQPECLPAANLTNLFCSHNLAVAFFAKSIVNPNIKAYSCSWLLNPLCYYLGYGLSTSFGQSVPSSASYTTYYLNITSTY